MFIFNFVLLCEHWFWTCTILHGAWVWILTVFCFFARCMVRRTLWPVLNPRVVSVAVALFCVDREASKTSRPSEANRNSNRWVRAGPKINQNLPVKDMWKTFGLQNVVNSSLADCACIDSFIRNCHLSTPFTSPCLHTRCDFLETLTRNNQCMKCAKNTLLTCAQFASLIKGKCQWTKPGEENVWHVSIKLCLLRNFFFSAIIVTLCFWNDSSHSWSSSCIELLNCASLFSGLQHCTK